MRRAPEASALDILKRCYHPDSLETVRSVRRYLDDAVLFDIGAQIPGSDHIELAAELMEQGKFQLPFPVTALRYKQQTTEGKMQDTFCMLTDQSSTRTDGHYGFVEFYPGIIQTANATGFLPAYAMDFKLEVKPPPPEVEDGLPVAATGAVIQIASDMAVEYAWSHYDKDGRAQASLQLAAMACGAVAMMMCKGVTVHHHPAPEKLNRARDRKHKPRIEDSYVIKVNTEHRTRYHTSELGYTRESPCVHWRRGHQRTLRKGAQAGKVLAIPRVHVMYRGEIDYRPADYEVK